MSNFMSKSPESEPEEVPEEVESEPQKTASEERYYEVDSSGEVISSTSTLDMSELIDSIEELQKKSHNILLSVEKESSLCDWKCPT